jgi:tetratricopeptide (TPR) repeat protein
MLSRQPVLAHGDLHERIARLTDQIKKEPQDPQPYLQRAELHRLHGEWEAALADYARVERLDTNLFVVDLGRGKTLVDAGQLPQAKLCLDRFLARQPDHVDALITRARLLVQLSQFLPAVNDFTRAIGKCSQPQPEFFIERAQALAAIGSDRIDEAIRGLDEGIQKLGPVITLQLPALDLELGKQRYDGAVKRIDQIIGQLQRKESWLARRAEVLVLAGRLAEAQKAYGDALAAIEALPEAHRYSPVTLDLEKQVHAQSELLAAKQLKLSPTRQ